MDVWDALIVVVAAYVALMSLVRLMAGRRNELIDEVQSQIERHQAAERHKLLQRPRAGNDRTQAPQKT